MSEGDANNPPGAERAQALLAMARAEARDNRRRLFDSLTDFLLAPDARLSDRERALIGDILGKLVDEVEAAVRRDLAERLAVLDWAPRELVLKLANEGAAVARPLLLRSRQLLSADLIELVKHRSQEHRLAIAMRSGISAAVSQALIDYGDEDVIETLVRNKDAEISREAIEYLVEESRRVDRFQEPLLRRADLPPILAARMFWWVSAALRSFILTEFALDETALDDAIESSVVAQRREAAPRPLPGEVLAARLGSQLTPRSLIQSLRSGQVSMFVAGMARLAGLPVAIARRIVFAPAGEALVACCRAAGFDRAGFATVFLLLRESRESQRPLTPDAIEKMLTVFDELSPAKAQAILRLWTRDADYFAAVDYVESQRAHVG